MRWMMTEVETYLEEIIEELDFSVLDQFLNEHMRTEMTFDVLVSQVALNGLDALNKENITMFVFDTVFYELSVAKPIFLKMLLFCILFSVVQRLLITNNKYISDMGFILIYGTLMVLLMQSFFLVRDIAIKGIDSLLMFLNALIPTYALTLVFSGNGISGAFVYEFAFLLVYLVEILMKNFLVPLIHIFILVLFMNHLFEEDKLSKLAQFLEYLVTFILKAAFGAVIGLSVVQSLLAPVKDHLNNNVFLSGISTIPGVGNVVGSAGEIILSCGMLIKNSVGVIGLLLLFIISVVPVLKVGCFWVMYHVLSIVLQPIADRRVTECVSSVARGCDLYLKIILYSMMLFFVLFSMVSVATSFIH